MSGETKGCLLFYVTIGVVILLALLYSKIKDNNNKYFFVEETGFFHSTNDEDKCKFIKSANEHGYTISKIYKNVPIENGYHICKECFTHNEQEEYIKDYNRRKVYNRHEYDHWMWEQLSLNHSLDIPFDFNELYVYLDTKNILHIDGNCIYCPITEGRVKRYSFSEIDSISSTCEGCVKREFCDFIYKKIYEGVYDMEILKNDIDDENDIDGEGY